MDIPSSELASMSAKVLRNNLDAPECKVELLVDLDPEIHFQSS